jgi:DNA polymerase family A
MFGLPFAEIWALDTEYIAEPGALPVPVCVVARELITGRLVRLWADELPATPPFALDETALFVSFQAAAEWGVFLQIGWPIPRRVLDLYVEFRHEVNGTTYPGRRSLLNALSYHGITSITADEKHEERSLVLRGGPWSEQERKRVLDYCQADTDALGPLLERMLPHILSRPCGLSGALLRGRYAEAVARMERTGIPVDVGTLNRIRDRWADIKLDLIKRVDADFGVYEGAVFKEGWFARWLTDQGIDWPRTPTGRLELAGDTFKRMTTRYPQLEPLRELRSSLAELRLERLTVGPDGRNRVWLNPFGTRTGRNAPPSTEFVFGPAKWIRSLIKPSRDRAVAYIDWQSQEVWIAAVLSGDQRMLDALAEGDVYLRFAKMAGLAPADATKASHETVRNVCKAAVLGSNYGQQARGLSEQIGISYIEAEDLLRRLAITFPTYWEWAQHETDVGLLRGWMTSRFGWVQQAQGSTRATSLRNYPMQANGSEMLRLACCLVTEAGVDVCCPVHDALLIEGQADDIEDVVQTAQTAMAKASRTILAGLEIPTDTEIVRWPDRYSDPRGEKMWSTVNDLL